MAAERAAIAPACLVPLVTFRAELQRIAEQIKRQAQEARDMDRMVRADSLSPAQRKTLWAHIQQHEPALLSWLQDPAIRSLTASPDACVLFPRDVVNAALGELQCA